MTARFIVLEGIEGTGKSTHAAYLADWLAKQGQPAVAAREPGGTPLGERLRTLLLDPGISPMPPQAEALLMFAARSASISEVILPALASGAWVVCDRFVESSYAYQAYGRGVPIEQVRALDRQIVGKLRPDLTVILDAPPELGLARKAGPEKKDRFEQESLKFFERVRQGYLQRAREGGGRYIVVDASRELAEVRKDLVTAIGQLLGHKASRDN
ncbi:MAG: dTMP kinase [Gammaproteobacteria bacterium]|nr:dTMP kinase [Gammaproteobacteria bacterium]